jgi:predicted enzyme related to lactoylglutathione lyase
MAVGPLAQLHITVTDIDKSVAFYRDLLGVPFLFQVPGQAMAFLQSGGVRLYLGKAESAAFTSRPLMYFRVDDLDAEHARLTAAGLAFAEAPHRVHRDDKHELWMAFTKDPDGATVGLMQEKPISPA